MTHIQSLAVHEKKYTAPAIAVDWRHHIRIRRAARLVAPHPSRASSAEHGGPLAAPRRLFHACPALFIDARDSIVRLSDEPGCRKPVVYLNLIPLPLLIEPNKALAPLFRTAHLYLNNLLLGLVALHVLAVLKHQFVDRDGLLTRMLPTLRAPSSPY